MINEVLDFVRSGGFVMPPLALATIVLWYALGWRMVTLGASRVGEMLASAKQSIAALPLDKLSRADRESVIDEQLFPLEQECSRYRTVIATIVMVAPLAGLLGTVAGMIETFDALGDMSLFTQSGGIAGGISQALVTTQMGLAVAIPGLIVGRLLDRRAENVIDSLRSIR